MSFTARASASARRLVDHFSGGTRVTLTRVTTGELQDDGSVTTTRKTATVSCSLPTPFGQSLRDGTRVLDGDLRTMVWKDDPALAFVPAAEDVAKIGTETYSVVSVDRAAGGYELHLRGGGA